MKNLFILIGLGMSTAVYADCGSVEQITVNYGGKLAFSLKTVDGRKIYEQLYENMGGNPGMATLLASAFQNRSTVCVDEQNDHGILRAKSVTLSH